MENCKIPDYVHSIFNHFKENNFDKFPINITKEITIQIRNKNYFKSNLLSVEYQGIQKCFEKENICVIKEQLKEDLIYDKTLNRLPRNIVSKKITNKDTKEVVNLNKKKFNISFLIGNGKAILDILSLIKNIFEDIPLRDVQDMISFNIIIVNFFEFSEIININLNEIPRDLYINSYLINYSEIKNFIKLKPHDIPKILVTNKYNKCIHFFDYFTSILELKQITKSLIIKTSDNSLLKQSIIKTPTKVGEEQYESYREFKTFLKQFRYELGCSTNLETFSIL